MNTSSLLVARSIKLDSKCKVRFLFLWVILGLLDVSRLSDGCQVLVLLLLLCLSL